MQPILRKSLGSTVAIACLALVGCAKSEPERPENENLSKLMQAYVDASGELGHAPRNLKELQPYLEKQGDPDKILVSPRDQQPYEIRWGVSLRGFSPDVKMPAIIAYEKDGVDGERCVLTISGMTFMEDAEFERVRKARVVEMGPKKDSTKSGANK